jgi:hypothetical protein
MKWQNIEKHNNCQCDIRYRKFSGRQEPVPGLFCRNHGTFLDWLSQSDADILISSGVQIAEYKIKKKTKKPKVKSKNKPKWVEWVKLVNRKELGI